MRTFILSNFLLLFSRTTTAQITQIRDVMPFTQIEVSGAASVEFTQSDTLQVKVVANENEIANVFTTIQDGILTIKSKGNFKYSFKVYIKGNTLSKIVVNNASKFVTSNTLLVDSLSINASGASEVTLISKSRTIDLIISGASNINLTGNTQYLSSIVSGASTLKAYKLNSMYANITTSGAATAKVMAIEKLNANATGASSIKFKGEPKDVTAEASTASSISKIVGDDIFKQGNNKRDSTTLRIGKRQYSIISKNRDSNDTLKKRTSNDFHHWNGFTMGVNGWLSNGSFDMPKGQEYMGLNYAKSLNFQLNPCEKNIHIYKNYINLVVGLGFEWNQYEFINKTKLTADNNYTSGTIDTSGLFTYKKNRLRTILVNVPVLLEFNTNKNHRKSFHIAFGAVVGYKLGSRTRQVLEQNHTDITLIRKDDYNINPFRVNAHASIGYHNFTVFADYSLTSLFRNNKGPQLYPFTIGINLITF